MRLETGRYVFGRARKLRVLWFYFWRRDLRHLFVSEFWYCQIQTTWLIMFFKEIGGHHEEKKELKQLLFLWVYLSALYLISIVLFVRCWEVHKKSWKWRRRWPSFALRNVSCLYRCWLAVWRVDLRFETVDPGINYPVSYNIIIFSPVSGQFNHLKVFESSFRIFH